MTKLLNLLRAPSTEAPPLTLSLLLELFEIWSPTIQI